MSRLFRSAFGLVGMALALTACPRTGVDPQGNLSSLVAYVTQFNTNEVAVVDAVLKTPLGQPIKVGNGPIRMVLKPTGQQEFLYVLNRTGSTVSFVNRRSGSTEEEVAAGKNPEDMAISPDGRYLFVTSPDAGTVTRINVSSRLADYTLNLPAGFRPGGIAVNPNCPGRGADKTKDCTSVSVYVVNETVTAPATGSSTKVGQVKVLTSSASGIVDGPTINLNGAEKPLKAVSAVDSAGNEILYVTDLALGVGLWRIDMKANTAQIYGSAPVGLTYDAEIAPDGTVYASIPSRNQYVQIKTDGTAQLFPDKPKDTAPEPLALSSDGSELWIGFVGSSTMAYAAIQAGRPLELRGVTYSLESQSKDPPRDIVLAGGRGGN